MSSTGAVLPVNQLRYGPKEGFASEKRLRTGTELLDQMAQAGYGLAAQSPCSL